MPIDVLVNQYVRTAQVCKRIIKQQLAESHSMCEYANYVQVNSYLFLPIFYSHHLTYIHVESCCEHENICIYEYLDSDGNIQPMPNLILHSGGNIFCET